MTIYELHLAFQDGLDNISSSSYPNIPIEQRDRYLNLGAERFIKQRYGGNNIKQTGFEETQKRVDDLSNLVVYTRLNPTDPGFFQTTRTLTTYYELPVDYWFALTERVNINTSCGPINTKVPVYTHNDINNILENPFTRPKRERVFRVMASGINSLSITNLIQVFHEVNTSLLTYELAYIAQYVKLRGQTNLNQQVINGLPFTYTAINQNDPTFFRNLQYWFNPQCHQEIVDLAVQAALESIEHPRYQTFKQEYITQE